MDKNEKIIVIGGLALSVFLFLCAVINLFSGHIGAAIGSLGSGFFFFAISSAVYKKAKEVNSDTTSGFIRQLNEAENLNFMEEQK